MLASQLAQAFFPVGHGTQSGIFQVRSRLISAILSGVAHVHTSFDLGDFVKPRYGARRNFSFCVGQIRMTCKVQGVWKIEYRPVFSTGTPGSWTDEKNLELVRRGRSREPQTVRELKEQL